MSNILFTNALKKKYQKVPPIWFMRQAGRYHKHYQKLKEKYSFEELCKTPELSAEVALGPVNEFDFDVAILFSDILFALEGLGMNLKFNPGPTFKQNINKDNFHLFNDIDKAIELLNFQKIALQILKERLPKNKSLIGFVGGLWTLLTFAIGKKSKINKIEDYHLKFIEENLFPLLKLNIKLQLEAGAEIVMIFDSNLYNLNTKFFKNQYSLILKNLANEFPQKLGYYSRGKSFKEITPLLSYPFSGIGVDHNIRMKEIFQSNYTGFIQGNFNENLMLLEGKKFEYEVSKFINEMQDIEEKNGWICGLGHGINKNTPEKNVHLFIKNVRKSFS